MFDVRHEPPPPETREVCVEVKVVKRSERIRAVSPEKLASALRKVEEGRFASLEEYFAADDAYNEFLDELCAELKPTAEDYAWADRALGLAPEAL